VPELPSHFEDVVARCLQKERDRRFQDVGELGKALAPFAPRRARAAVERIVRTIEAGRASLAPTVPEQVEALAVTAPADSASVSGGTGAAWGATGAPRKTRRSTRLLAGALTVPAVLFVCVGGWLAMRAHRGAPVPLQSAMVSAGAPSSAPEPSFFAAGEPRPAASAPPSGTAADAAPPQSSAATSASPNVVLRPPPKRPALGAGPAAKPNCNPPYVIDPAGHRQYKPECL
jgi:serine/threonine-protein kinase